MINNSEKLDVVDINDQIIESLPREQVHKNMLLHRASAIWVVNNNLQILCQKRSIQKDVWPGMWECWFGGHVASGKTYTETAVTEIKEELDIHINADELGFFDKRITQTLEENLFLSIYILHRDIDKTTIKFERDEVEILDWIDISDLKTFYTNSDSSWVKYGYELEMIEWIKSQI
jgi:isopentenyldiphosphate isomerase